MNKLKKTLKKTVYLLLIMSIFNFRIDMLEAKTPKNKKEYLPCRNHFRPVDESEHGLEGLANARINVYEVILDKSGSPYSYSKKMLIGSGQSDKNGQYDIQLSKCMNKKFRYMYEKTGGIYK
jgi:hypothetical protein